MSAIINTKDGFITINNIKSQRKVQAIDVSRENAIYRIDYNDLPISRTHPEDRVNVQEQLQVILDNKFGIDNVKVIVKSLTPPIIRIYPL